MLALLPREILMDVVGRLPLVSVAAMKIVCAEIAGSLPSISCSLAALLERLLGKVVMENLAKYECWFTGRFVADYVRYGYVGKVVEVVFGPGQRVNAQVVFGRKYNSKLYVSWLSMYGRCCEIVGDDDRGVTFLCLEGKVEEFVDGVVGTGEGLVLWNGNDGFAPGCGVMIKNKEYFDILLG